MKLSQYDLRIRKRLYLISVVFFVSLYSLYCFVISPINVSLQSNVVYDESFLPELLSYLGKLSELIAISACYATIIYGIYLFGMKNCKASLLIFVLATAYKYGANVAVSWLFDGSIPSSWLWDVVNVLFFTVLETVQLAVILLLINPIITRFKQRNEILAKAGRAEEVYPFRSVYDGKNCLMKSALICAVVVFVSKIFGQVVNDLYYIIAAGLPKQGETVFLMATTYLTQLLYGALCYMAIVFSLMKLVKKPENQT